MQPNHRMSQHATQDNGDQMTKNGFSWAIWGFAFGYFAFYVPYSATAKALSKGLFEGMSEGVRGFSLLPASVSASLVGMILFLSVMRWWRYATQTQILGMSIPRPTSYTFASGLCTALIIATTTLAYTFDGVSIVFVMLLMRGGVLIIAPMIDSISGRSTQWFSWAGLALSLTALIIAFSERGGYTITLICAIDIVVYLFSYFTRLKLMSGRAKSEVADVNRRYFVEEQLVATPALLIMLMVFALIGSGPIAEQVRWGFTEVWESSVLGYVLLVGFLSQGTGVCGSLIFLDKRENTYCVPVNRCSSILAGLGASWLLTGLFGLPTPSTYKLAGAACIIGAILFLTLGPLSQRTRQSREADDYDKLGAQGSALKGS